MVFLIDFDNSAGCGTGQYNHQNLPIFTNISFYSYPRRSSPVVGYRSSDVIQTFFRLALQTPLQSLFRPFRPSHVFDPVTFLSLHVRKLVVQCWCWKAWVSSLGRKTHIIEMRRLISR